MGFELTKNFYPLMKHGYTGLVTVIVTKEIFNLPD